jgi:hypothetical protein
VGDRDAKAWVRTDAWALLVTVRWGTASWSVPRHFAIIIVIIYVVVVIIIVIIYVVVVIIIVIIYVVVIIIIVTDIVVRFRTNRGDMMVMNIAWNRIVIGGRNNGATAIIISSNSTTRMLDIIGTRQTRLSHTG